MSRDPDISRFVRLALDCVQREYPHHIVHLAFSDADIRAPRQLNPAFYGCFDWHSAIHSHWMLARAIRLYPAAPWARDVRAVVARNLTQENLANEANYMRAPGREGFERPYGLAWLLQLAAELREMDDPDARNWLDWLTPLELLAAQRLGAWLHVLGNPIRSGEHGQTAFAIGLALDWARCAHDEPFAQLLARRARDFHESDRDAPLQFEPSLHDFLSPCLAEADLLRRVMSGDEFSAWLSGFLPQIRANGSTAWLAPVASPDPSDGKLSHLDGLNLSRAWMLEGIASALRDSDPRRSSLLSCAQIHASAGLAAVSAKHYSGAHWLGSFAVYLLTKRGLSATVT